MKKIFAILLVLCMLVPFVASCSCGGDDTTTTIDDNTTTVGGGDDTTTAGGGDNTTAGGGTTPSTEKIDSKNKQTKKWEGTVLNVLATGWDNTVAAPWSQMELCIKSYDEPSGFGTLIDEAVLERREFIEDTYGVTFNWVEATENYMIASDLEAAAMSETDSFEIAMPRVIETQGLVLSSQVYDMSQNLDFSRKDFGTAVHDVYTVAGCTFFTAGDFNTLDEETSYVLFFNRNMGVDADELYEMVKNGTWTMDELENIAKAIKQDDGDGVQTDDDTYGLSVMNFSRMFSYAGIFEASINKETGLYEASLNTENTIKLVDTIIKFKKATDWCRSGWGGNWGSNALDAFEDGRLLFYNECVKTFKDLADSDIDVGVVPFPKLTVEQERYYAPAAIQTTVMCVPRDTSDRDASEYFIDVLSWTGSEYIMTAYYESLESIVAGESDLDILKTYVLPNVSLDIGESTSGWAGFLGSVRENCHASDTNSFQTLYDEALVGALPILESWNTAWSTYVD